MGDKVIDQNSKNKEDDDSNKIIKHEDESIKETNESNSEKKVIKKEKTPGVIYLSRIPTKMNVKLIREYFSNIGDVGRVYLEPRPDDKKRKNHPTSFIEGWVEFKKKRDAKRAAKMLNNNQVGGKRRNPWYHELWNIKYLKEFRWTHLNERLAYEQEIRKQRLRQEVSLAKKEANFYIQNFEKSENRKKIEKRMQKNQDNNKNSDELNSASTSLDKTSKDSNDNLESKSKEDLDQPYNGKRKHPLFERKIKVTGNDTFLKQIFS